MALTSVLEDASVVEPARAGAIRYLLNDTKAAELRRAIKTAALGQVQLSPETAARLMLGAAARGRTELLSEREVEALRLLVCGLANKESARDLSMTEKRVRTHVSSILAKLGSTAGQRQRCTPGRIGLTPVNQLGSAQ